jgi:hypothetical protein
LERRIETAFRAANFDLHFNGFQQTIIAGHSPMGVEIITKEVPDNLLHEALMQLFQEIGQTPRISTDPHLSQGMTINIGDREP